MFPIETHPPPLSLLKYFWVNFRTYFKKEGEQTLLKFITRLLLN